MTRLISLGLVAAFFFSSTFVLNRMMSLEGGHWVWTASLRYGYMLIFLGIWLAVTHGLTVFRRIWDAFAQHWQLWVSAGKIGFGLFYACLSFAASHAPGWIIGSTFLFTVVATPIVLITIFKQPVPRRGVLTAVVIFIGIVIVNLDKSGATTWKDLLQGAVPALVAAFAYPIGNQMVKAKAFTATITQEAPARVLLLTLESLPFWFVTLLVTNPPPPSTGQLINTAIVALLSGVVATSIFLHARHLAKTTYQIAAVDATQAAEIPFMVIGELALLHTALPQPVSLLGIALIIGGLVRFTVAPAHPK